VSAFDGHTPGPWQQRDDQTSEGWVTIIGNVDGEYVDGRAVCTYDVIARCEDEYGDRLSNVSANARLITAAPDLLALAQRMREALADAREALHFHYTEWDGEPEDAVPLQLARSKCDATLTEAAALLGEK